MATPKINMQSFQQVFDMVKQEAELIEKAKQPQNSVSEEENIGLECNLKSQDTFSFIQLHNQQDNRPTIWKWKN